MRCIWPGLLGVSLFASVATAQQPSAAGVRDHVPFLPAAVAPFARGLRCNGSPRRALQRDGPCPRDFFDVASAAASGDGRGSAWSVPASALVPGSGQAMLGTLRFIPYVAIEVLGWSRYAGHSGDARRWRDGYRDLAARVARAPFAGSGTPPIGDFDYYERMEHFEESGRYDIVPGGPLDPETDSLTYNGYIWQLARRTYWTTTPGVTPDTSSSEYKQSIAFYQHRAYDGAYRWSWTNSPAELQRYRSLIHDSNESHRRAMQDLGLVIANHVLSTVDAYITVRVRRTRSAAGDGFLVRASLPLAKFLPR